MTESRPRITGAQLSQADRLLAPAACEQNGWTEGTVLVSEDWATPYLVRGIDSIEVEVQYDGRKRRHLKTFPSDVRKADE